MMPSDLYCYEDSSYMNIKKQLERIESICRLDCVTLPKSEFLSQSYDYVTREFDECVTSYRNDSLSKQNTCKAWMLVHGCLVVLEGITKHSWESNYLSLETLRDIRSLLHHEPNQNLLQIPLEQLISPTMRIRNIGESKKISKYTQKFFRLICLLLNYCQSWIHFKDKEYNSTICIIQAIKIQNIVRNNYLDLFMISMLCMNLCRSLGNSGNPETQIRLIKQVLLSLEEWIPKCNIVGIISYEDCASLQKYYACLWGDWKEQLLEEQIKLDEYMTSYSLNKVLKRWMRINTIYLYRALASGYQRLRIFDKSYTAMHYYKQQRSKLIADIDKTHKNALGPNPISNIDNIMETNDKNDKNTEHINDLKIEWERSILSSKNEFENGCDFALKYSG